jgi:hypothetical protein
MSASKYLPCRLLPRGGEDGAEVVQAGFDVFHYFFGEVFGGREGCRGWRGFCFEPKDVETGFVAGGDVGLGKFAPAAEQSGFA